MTKLKKTIFWTILVTESSHIFCCVLPTIFSLLSLLVGLGVVGIMPLWLEAFHSAVHSWEVPLLMTSAFVIALGWGLHSYSRKIDCHDTGCAHGACEPRKDRSLLILQIATALFVINALVYVFLHRPADLEDVRRAVGIEDTVHDHH